MNSNLGRAILFAAFLATGGYSGWKTIVIKTFELTDKLFFDTIKRRHEIKKLPKQINAGNALLKLAATIPAGPPRRASLVYDSKLNRFTALEGWNVDDYPFEPEVRAPGTPSRYEIDRGWVRGRRITTNWKMLLLPMNPNYELGVSVDVVKEPGILQEVPVPTTQLELRSPPKLVGRLQVELRRSTTVEVTEVFVPAYTLRHFAVESSKGTITAVSSATFTVSSENDSRTTLEPRQLVEPVTYSTRDIPYLGNRSSSVRRSLPQIFDGTR